MAYDENIYAKIISGELSNEEIAQLKQTGEWQEIEAILQATDELSLSPFDKQKGYEALLNKRDKKPSNIRKIIFLGVASIAAVALLLFGFFFFMNSPKSNTFAPNGQLAEVKLGNDVEVVLNDGSSLEYTEEKKNNKRIVVLKGEAFFKVVPGNKFIVKTPNGSVEVLGTQFNVRAWGDNLKVDCYSGRVVVNSKQSRAELKAKEGLTVINSSLKNNFIVENESPNWIEGSSRIRQESLVEVFKELERQFDVQIKYPAINRPFSGVFTHDNLEEALVQVCAPMGLKFKIVNDALVEVYE